MKNKNHLRPPVQTKRGPFCIKTILALILLFSGVLFLAGCAPKLWLPKASPDYVVEEGWAIVKTDSLTLFTKVKPYSANSSRLSSDYFAIFVRVKNTSGKTVALRREAFALHTSEQTLYPLPLQTVAGSLDRRGFMDPFSETMLEEKPQDWEERELALQEQYLRLADNFFGFGNILPGGSKEGWLFFDLRAGNQNAVSLELPSGSVEFIRD